MNSGYELSQTIISLVAIAFIYGFVLRRQAAESCRAELRSIRDQFFDFMWQNNKDFSDVDYVETRQQINGMLRLTTMIGPVSFIMMMFRFMPVVVSRDFTNNRKESEISIRARGVKKEAINCLVRYIFLTGILGLVLKLVFYLFKAWKRVRMSKDWAVARTWAIVDFVTQIPPNSAVPRGKSVFG